MTTQDAVAWLRQQIGVKLAAARGLACTGTGQWGVTCNGDYDYTIADASDVLPKANAVADCWGEAVAYFIADNDPQGVIARCEAELAILDFRALAETIAGAADDGQTGERSEAQQAKRRLAVLDIAVGHLASVYRHREGYAEHWGSGD